MRRANFRQRVWEPATKAVGVSGLRFHDLRHTAATLAAGSGTSLRALMSRIGHASPRAALRYQHVIDGQDADIVRYLERFDQVPPTSAVDRDDPQPMGTRRARPRNLEAARPSRLRLTWDNGVEAIGLEPTTSCLQSKCSSQLSYAP